MNFTDRLKKYLDYRGISLNAFDKSIGAGNGYIGKQIKKGGSVGSDVIEKIISLYTDISIDWLISGKGNMINIKLESSTNDFKEKPPDKNNDCLLCREKDRRIEDLKTQIALQSDYIEHLKEQSPNTNSSGQKRKAS